MKQKSSFTAKPKTSQQKIVHVSNKNIELTEDHFGIYTNELNQRHYIQRFTWKNHNKIEAQIITYGARVTSLKLPNRKGIVEDVVLGFDDLGGYLHYDQLFMGATIGRVTSKVRRGTCVINGKQYWLSVNDTTHHSHGGFIGFDKVVWNSCVEGNKVLLSYVSRDVDEGYPGDLLVCITFELTSANEFIIDMDARTTKPTIVNLSNLIYFNLGAHGSGPENTSQHIVSINSNCFLPMDEDDLPSGEILNVLYSRNDLQVPRLLKSELGNNHNGTSGYDSYFCVNRGVNQDLCFIARALHPPSGRVLEIYSNQRGVYFGTANDFGDGVVDLPLNGTTQSFTDITDDTLTELLTTLHCCVAETLTIDSRTNYSELKDLVKKLLKSKNVKSDMLEPTEGNIQLAESNTSALSLSLLQIRYLEHMAKVAFEQSDKELYQEVGTIVRKLIDRAVNSRSESNDNAMISSDKSIKTQTSNYVRARNLIRSYNKVLPMYTNDQRVHGKNGAIYKDHCAMCFRTQNYPNAINHSNFPSSELRPGETYKHTIVYRFWLQSGDPTPWIRRNCTDEKKLVEDQSIQTTQQKKHVSLQ